MKRQLDGILWFDRVMSIGLPLLVAFIMCAAAAVAAFAADAPKMLPGPRAERPVMAPNGLHVRFFEEPCPASHAWLLPLQRAELVVGSEERAACWLYVEVNGGSAEDYVHVIDDHLTLYRIPAHSLRFINPP